MAPSTRSSVPIPTTPVASKASAYPQLPTPQSMPRKSHQCRTCGRPRIGHPRSGCPYGDSTASAPVGGSHDLTAALSTLSIDNFADRKRTVSRRRSKPIQQSTAMVIDNQGDTESDSDADEDTNATLRQWREGVSTPVRKREFQEVMPGTLVTPNSSILATEIASDQGDIEIEAETFHGAKTDMEDEGFIRRPRPPQQLIRSLSIEERAAFLDGLAEISRAPPATVYLVSLADLPMLQATARKVRFFARSVLPVEGSEESEAFFIIGRDEAAVERLYIELSKDVKKKGGISAVQLASGAVMGAVATFGTLAFS